MVHTRLLRKFAVERQIAAKSAPVGCHGFGCSLGLSGGRAGGHQEQPAATCGSPGEPRRARESQESSGAGLGEPRATQNTLNMTLFLGTLVRRFLLANLVSQARGHPESSKSAR